MISKQKRSDITTLKWKIVSFAIVIIMMLSYFLLRFVNLGSTTYGSFFTKLHYKTNYFVQECSEENCRFLPAEIEIIKNAHFIYIEPHVYLTKIVVGDGKVVEFNSQLNVKDYQSLPIFDAVKYIGKPYFISGCHVDFDYMSKFVKCTDSSGKVWNVRIPKTNEIKNI